MVNRKYFRVYSKTTWSGEWVRRTKLECLSVTVTAPPAVGTATIRNWYGLGKYEDGTDLTDGTTITDFSDHYFKITQCDNETGTNEKIIFIGRVPGQEFRPLGYSEYLDTTTVDQDILIYSIDAILGQSKIYGSYITNDGSTTQLVDIDVEFNNRLGYGQIDGNRSAGLITLQNIQAFAFDARKSGREIWSAWNIIAYHLARHHPQSGPVFAFPTEYYNSPQPDIIAALDSLKTVYNNKNKSVRDVFNDLATGKRGFGWGVDYAASTGTTIVLRLWSVLETSFTIGTTVFPAHDSTDVTTVYPHGNANDDLIITRSETNYDKVVVIGAPIKVCGTLWCGDDPATQEPIEDLVQGWTAADETSYKAAAVSATGYDSMEKLDQEAINDFYRTAEQYNAVYTRFVVPDDFNWKIGPNNDILNLYFDWDQCDFVLETQATYWNGQKRFLPYLPFKEGWDYSNTTPVDNTQTGSEEQYRKILAIAVNADGTRYVNLEKLKAPANVTPLTKKFGVSVRFNPPHKFAYNHWIVGASGTEPSELDDDFDEKAMDWETMLVTAMVETDQVFGAQYVINSGVENERVLKIELPNAEMWRVVPNTVIDIDVEGQPVLYGCTDTTLRDDREIVKAVLAAAAAYYGRPRYKISLTSSDFEWSIKPGTMIIGLNIEGDGTRGGCISAITYDLQAMKITIHTENAELDFSEIGSASAEIIGGSRTRLRGESQVVSVKKDVEELRNELYRIVDKSPSQGDSGKASAGYEYAKVITGLSYPENYNISVYKVRLTTDTTPTWTAGTYNEGDTVIGSDGLKYISLIDNNTDDPVGSSNWEVSPEITISNFYGKKNATVDLRDYMPWFAPEEIIRVIKDPDAETETWLIFDIMTHTGDPEDSSIRWNETGGRMSSCIV